MLCSSQPNREFARAPIRIFVWRRYFRVCVRANGTDPYGKSEPLQGARGGPRRRRVPAAQRSRRREVLPRRSRRRRALRGRSSISAEPEMPECGARGAWRDGSVSAGVPKWRCRCCGRRFTFLKGAVLERCRNPSPPGSPSSESCAPTSPSSARPSCAASPTRRPSSGGAARSPQYPATRTGSCCAMLALI